MTSPGPTRRRITAPPVSLSKVIFMQPSVRRRTSLTASPAKNMVWRRAILTERPKDRILVQSAWGMSTNNWDSGPRLSGKETGWTLLRLGATRTLNEAVVITGWVVDIGWA